VLLRLALATAAALVLAGAALADATDPKQRLSRAGQTRAAGTLIRGTDLGPGWLGGARMPTSLKSPKCPAYSPNDSDLTLVGHAEALFANGNGGVQVDNDVEIFKTKAQAAKRFARILQPKVGTCLRYDLLKSLGGSGVLIEGAKRLKLPKVAEHTAAFRVPLDVKSGGQTVTVYSDFVFLNQGVTQIYLNVVAPSSLKAQLDALELRLARTLAGRAGH
jgi:hypothetical protein